MLSRPVMHSSNGEAGVTDKEDLVKVGQTPQP